MDKLKIGVIGCGVISERYLSNCTGKFGAAIEVAAVADIVRELAEKRAAEFNVPKVMTVEDLLADPEIELVLNLTAPAAHAPLNLKALHAGKHVYTEKPFALTREDADAVLKLAHEKGLRVGCAPDTFLGAGIQTCRKIIDDGWIGTPYAASGTILMGNAAGGMHPNFQNFLKLGGDPILDMGPYYLTALVAFFGPAARVSGSTGRIHSSITVTNPKSPRYGETVPVEAPTHASAIIDFANGITASLQAAKESFGYSPRLEVYGTEGILYAPDPNFFSGEIKIKQADGTVRDFPLSHGFTEESRGLGVADMAYAIRSGRPHRANGEMARHILDVSLGIFESSDQGRHVNVGSTCEQPAPLPMALKYNALD